MDNFLPILWIELQTNKIQKIPKPHISTSSGKKFANWKDFFEKFEQRSNIIFQKVSCFILHRSFLSIYLLKLMHKK